jgi:hypothetical protein
VLPAEIHRKTTRWGYSIWQQKEGSTRRAICDNRLDDCRAARENAAGRQDAHAAAVGAFHPEVVAMANLLDLAMLICASVGAMAFGILAAYAILRAGFALMRPQRRPKAVKAQAQAARVS